MTRRKEHVFEIKYMSPRPICIDDEFYIVVHQKGVEIVEVEDHYAFSGVIHACKFGVEKIKVISCEMNIDYRDLVYFHAVSEGHNKIHEYFSIKDFYKRYNRPGYVKRYKDPVQQDYISGIYDDYELALKEAARLNDDVQRHLDEFNQKYGTKFSIKEEI